MRVRDRKLPLSNPIGALPFHRRSRTLCDMDTMALGTPAPALGVVAPLPGGTAALIGLGALVVVMVPFLSPLARHANVMAHEGAHALAAVLLGFTLETVILRRETGETTWRAARGAVLRLVTVWFVGYLGPSLFGLGAAKLIETGRVTTVLWLLILLLVLLFFFLGRSLGMISVPVAIFLLVLVTRNAHAWLEEVVVYGLTWLLLLDGVRIAVAHGVNADDAALLRGRTHIHPRFWSLLWIAATVLAVVIGGKWLVLRS
jgi:Peptidase M50B-like